MFGGFSSSVLVKIANDYHSNLYTLPSNTTRHYYLSSHQGQLEATGISVAIGIASGLLVGIIVNIASYMVTSDHYHDRSFWLTEQDCISKEEDIHLPE